VQRFAGGGRVATYPFKVDVSKTRIPPRAEVLAVVMASGSGESFGKWPSSPSAQRGDSGVWKRVVALIKSTGPYSGTFGNAYRAGDPLWHGSGRAVDWMGYNQDKLAAFLAARRPLELIHRTDRRDYAFTRGKDMDSFNASLMEAHRDHIHAAFDQGGQLLPGWNLVPNFTGQPEPVLSPGQWRSIEQFVAQGMAGGSGSTYNFEFANTTLDAGRLRAMQDREAVLARHGRAR
jgi:hypothetical protein